MIYLKVVYLKGTFAIVRVKQVAIEDKQSAD